MHVTMAQEEGSTSAAEGRTWIEGRLDETEEEPRCQEAGEIMRRAAASAQNTLGGFHDCQPTGLSAWVKGECVHVCVPRHKIRLPNPPAQSRYTYAMRTGEVEKRQDRVLEDGSGMLEPPTYPDGHATREIRGWATYLVEEHV